MKAVVAAFNQEKALVGAFSVIVKNGCGTDGSICGTIYSQLIRRVQRPIKSVKRGTILLLERVLGGFVVTANVFSDR